MTAGCNIRLLLKFLNRSQRLSQLRLQPGDLLVFRIGGMFRFRRLLIAFSLQFPVHFRQEFLCPFFFKTFNPLQNSTFRR